MILSGGNADNAGNSVAAGSQSDKASTADQRSNGGVAENQNKGQSLKNPNQTDAGLKKKKSGCC